MPQTALVEVAYLLGRDGDAGIQVVVTFLQGLSASKFILTELISEDIIRIGEILAQYADSKVDFVDASVMAMAERLNVKTILTIDQRDFRLFRPKHCGSFTILPSLS